MVDFEIEKSKTINSVCIAFYLIFYNYNKTIGSLQSFFEEVHDY